MRSRGATRRCDPKIQWPRKDELVGAGFCLGGGERTTSVRPAYAMLQVQKAAGGMRTVRNWDESRTARRIREEGGALFVSQRKTRKLQMPSGAGATEQRTGKEHAAWTRSEDASGGASGSLYRYARRASSQQSARGMAKRNGKAKCGAKRCKDLPLAFARPRRSPAKFTRSTRIRMLVFAKVPA